MKILSKVTRTCSGILTITKVTWDPFRVATDLKIYGLMTYIIFYKVTYDPAGGLIWSPYFHVIALPWFICFTPDCDYIVSGDLSSLDCFLGHMYDQRAQEENDGEHLDDRRG